MTIVVGITGGIGSGKTTLSKYLETLKYKVHDSDKEVSLIYKKQTNKLKKALIGAGLKKSIKKNYIDKKIIANKIFENEESKTKIEKFIHKEIKKKRSDFIKINKAKKEKVIFIDIPLLFENKLDHLFNKIICIVSTKKNRKKRIRKYKKISKKTLDNIIKSQITDKERRLRSDYLITNNETKKTFIKRTKSVIKDILKWERL